MSSLRPTRAESMASKKTTKKTTKKTAAKKVTKRAPPAPAVAKATPGQVDLAEKDRKIDLLIQGFTDGDKRLLIPASEAVSSHVLRRPTGIMELDIHLGGGWPANGCCVLGGPDNSGKTYLMFKTGAMQQRLHGHASRIAFGFTESSFPFDQALLAGLKVAVPDPVLEQWQEVRRRRGIPLYTNEELLTFKEQVGRVLLYRGDTGEEVLQVTLDCCRENAFSLICLDSVNGLNPAANVGKELDDHNKMAARAVLLEKFFDRYAPITTGLHGKNETTLLLSAQVRANKSKAEAPSYIQKYLPDYVTYGSWALKHYALIRLIVSSGSPLKDSKKEAIGKELKWAFEKGKAGAHDNVVGSTNYYYPYGVDIVGELMTAGIKRGIIVSQGREVAVRRPDTGEILREFTAPSQTAMRKMIEADIEYELALRREILTQAGIQCLYQ